MMICNETSFKAKPSSSPESRYRHQKVDKTRVRVQCHLHTPFKISLSNLIKMNGTCERMKITEKRKSDEKPRGLREVSSN